MKIRYKMTSLLACKNVYIFLPNIRTRPLRSVRFGSEVPCSANFRSVPKFYNNETCILKKMMHSPRARTLSFSNSGSSDADGANMNIHDIVRRSLQIAEYARGWEGLCLLDSCTFSNFKWTALYNMNIHICCTATAKAYCLFVMLNQRYNMDESAIQHGWIVGLGRRITLFPIKVLILQIIISSGWKDAQRSKKKKLRVKIVITTSLHCEKNVTHPAVWILFRNGLWSSDAFGICVGAP